MHLYFDHVFKCPYRKEVYLKHPKSKGNINIEKGIRSKVKCRSSAHFPPICDATRVISLVKWLVMLIIKVIAGSLRHNNMSAGLKWSSNKTAFKTK